MTDPVSMFVLAMLALVQPSHLACPRGWYVEGVRPSGETTCAVSPEIDDSDGAWLQPRIAVKIYCREGERPIVVDYRRVACRVR